ncbi:MAG TPA: hypothetical protein VFI27_12290 [candidate division Zixibacteria bacterium]|nr:hypothetical protein [candidate division Zixibacteria bacterium]
MTSTETDETTEFAISLFDLSDGNSLPNRAPAIVTEALKKTPADYFEISESKLQQACRADDRDKALRLRFWDEYHAACRESRIMRVDKIRALTMVEKEFRKKVHTAQRWLAYICTEPPSLWALNQNIIRLAIDHTAQFITQVPKKKVVERKFDPETGACIWEKAWEEPVPGVEKIAADIRKESQTVPITKRDSPRVKKEDRVADYQEVPDEEPAEPLVSPEDEMEELNKALAKAGK